MRILTIVYPSTGIGESYMAVSFSKQLLRCGHEVAYMGNETLKFILDNKSIKIFFLKNSLTANKILFDKVMEKFCPHAILFTDYHMYKRNQIIKIPFDFEWLKSKNVKTYILDTIGNCYKNSCESSIFGPNRISLKIPNWVSKIIRPVPLHDPIKDFSNDVNYCALLNHVSTIPKIDKMLNESHANDSKIILFPIGNWINEISGNSEKKSLKLIIDTILTYINNLNIRAKVITFGYWDYGSRSEFKNIEIDQSFSQLSIEETDYLIKKSNLVITINAISNMASRAIQSNIRVVTFINSKSITSDSIKHDTSISENNRKKILKCFDYEHNIVSKYMMFPEKDIEILSEFYSVNKVTKSLMNIIEVFDEKQAAEMLREILIKDEENKNDLHSDYIESCKGLLSLSEIIEEK